MVEEHTDYIIRPRLVDMHTIFAQPDRPMFSVTPRFHRSIAAQAQAIQLTEHSYTVDVVFDVNLTGTLHTKGYRSSGAAKVLAEDKQLNEPIESPLRIVVYRQLPKVWGERWFHHGRHGTQEIQESMS